DGPHTIVNIAKKIDTTPNFLGVESLVEHGVLGMIGFTPTDILHLSGEYTAGSVRGAEVAALLMARSRGADLKVFLENTRELITEKLCRTIAESAMDYQRFSFTPVAEDKTKETLFQKAVWGKDEEILSVRYDLNIPIIGIGAPIKAWLRPAAEKFNAEITFPAHNDVANAVGAAAGKVMTVYRIKVQNHEEHKIGIYAPWGKIPFFASDYIKVNEEGQEYLPSPDELMRQAIAIALDVGKEKIREEMIFQGVKDYEVLVEQKDVITGGGYNDSMRLHIETFLDIMAVGRPQWQSQ
ncbi:MAG: hypothetical protein Q4C00_05355, partial [Bacillota bacterium]|nr:hypothetical protein [Bacillota bacterium]